MNVPKHILVIRLSAMGDVAMTVPVLQAFRRNYPKVKLTIVSKGFFAPIFKEIPGINFVEAAVQKEHKGVLGLLQLARQLKGLDIDAVADLHNVIRSKIISKYLKFQGIKSATIDKGRAEKKAIIRAKGSNLNPIKTTHERYADVFRSLGFEMELQPPVFPKRKTIPLSLQEKVKKSSKKWVGMAPFAAYESKSYPLSMIEKVIESLLALGNYEVFLFGGGTKEATQLEAVAQKYDGVVSIAGTLSFEEELALISNLDGMLAMDSGNGHLAALYGIPVITLWGVTHPATGFTPFNQPLENQLLADRTQYPMIPTSIYGNKYPEGYEKAIVSIKPETIVQKISERF